MIFLFPIFAFQLNFFSASHVEVNGAEIYYEYFNAGSDVVIFEAGARADSDTWRLVSSELKKLDVSYVVYDRAGLGRSDITKVPRTGTQIACDLHELLNKLGIQSPVILVGHSMGGVYHMIYASLFPDQVRAMLLVEVPHRSWENELLQCLSNQQRQSREQSIERMLEGLNINNRQEADAVRNSFLYLQHAKLPNCEFEILTGTNHHWPESYDARCLSDAWRRTQHRYLEEIPGAKFSTSDSGGHQLQLEDHEKVFFLIKKLLK